MFCAIAWAGFVGCAKASGERMQLRSSTSHLRAAPSGLAFSASLQALPCLAFRYRRFAAGVLVPTAIALIARCAAESMRHGCRALPQSAPLRARARSRFLVAALLG